MRHLCEWKIYVWWFYTANWIFWIQRNCCLPNGFWWNFQIFIRQNSMQHFAGEQVHKIRVGYNGQVQVDKVLEPYDLTSRAYQMSLNKTSLPDVEYINQISYFRLLKDRVRKKNQAAMNIFFVLTFLMNHKLWKILKTFIDWIGSIGKFWWSIWFNRFSTHFKHGIPNSKSCFWWHRTSSF